MKCIGCGADQDLRCRYCFDCASHAEERASKRTVIQHLLKACWHLLHGYIVNARIDVKWAYERAFQVGDYSLNGEFVRLGYFKPRV